MNVFDVLAPVGKPWVWKSYPMCDCPDDSHCPEFWVVEYWVKKTICEKFFKSWHEAISFALAQATA